MRRRVGWMDAELAGLLLATATTAVAVVAVVYFGATREWWAALVAGVGPALMLPAVASAWRERLR